MSDSEVILFKDGAMAFSGDDAIRLFHAMALKSAIGLLEHGIPPARGYTMTKALAGAGAFTGKTYKRTESAQAKADLQVWIDAMKTALPIREEM